MAHLVSRRLALIVATLTLAMGIPLGVALAAHFGDVPNSHPFHNDIAAISDAGVTSGCGGGDFCPDRNVTRAEMAAFLNRLGALGPGKEPVVDAATLNGATVLGAVVESDGSLVSGEGAVSSVRTGTGHYRVTFSRSLVGCIRVATPGEPGNGTNGAEIFSTEISSTDPTNRTVFAATHSINTTTLKDNPFHLMILCPG